MKVKSKMLFIFPIGLFICFYLDGIFSQLYSYLSFSQEYQAVSYFILIWLVLAVAFEKYINLHIGWWALLIGFLYDSYYSGIIGVYLFGFPLIVYISRFLCHHLPSNFLTNLVVFGVGLIVMIGLGFLANEIVQTKMAMDMIQLLLNKILPTIFLNIVLFILLYQPILWLYERFN